MGQFAVIDQNMLCACYWPVGEVTNGRFVNFSFQNLDLAEWPVWRNATDQKGSLGISDERPLSGIGIQ